MLSFGSLSFLSPWLLAPLAGLQVLWWLLRLTPPAPRKIDFPAIRLLMSLKAQEETPAHTQWWLLLLRILIVALVLVGLAEPVLNPVKPLNGTQPLLLVFDDGWASGPVWSSHVAAAGNLLAGADRTGREVRLLFTAPPVRLTEALQAADARQQLASHVPAPWPGDRAEAAKLLAGLPASSIHYFSDGVNAPGTRDFLEALREQGETRLYRLEGGRLPLLLPPPENVPDGLEVTVRRGGALPENNIMVSAIAADGRLLAREPLRLETGRMEGKTLFRLPAELRSRIARVQVDNEPSAGSVMLLDEAWHRRPVGLVAQSGADRPLVGPLFYLERALKPHAEILKGDTTSLLAKGITLLVLADIGNLGTDEQSALTKWMEQGGVLVRFAGPNLAANPDALLPVKLRQGERVLGGALSWTSPASLSPFPPASPLSGLAVPEDITVSRQVLAEPEADLPSRTWAQLADGTPLVTAKPTGRGWLVLVHTSANADWTNLPLSGLYVDMLRRFLWLGSGLASGELTGPLQPIETLNGFGHPVSSPATAQPVPADEMKPDLIGPAHPPGFYGREGMREALNLPDLVTKVEPFDSLPAGVTEATTHSSREQNLMPWCLAAALLLLGLDALVSLRLRGLLAPALALLLLSVPARADDTQSGELAAETFLAYVTTEDSVTDTASAEGLQALARILRQRTSVDPKEVLGVDLETDDLAFFPLLYWPVTISQPALSSTAREKINRYLAGGGLILFDTQDGSAGRLANASLQKLAAGLDMPPLAPLPPDHVLSKSFYLLDAFPGRFAEGQIWVDAEPERRNDNVSGILIGSNDWASAWAGQGGNTEMARRFGINLVMYALTGSYKSDQLHVRALLNRMDEQ